MNIDQRCTLPQSRPEWHGWVSNETKTINDKVSQFIVEEKNEIVEYQKENWQKGKEQIAQSKKKISNFWIKAWRLVRLYTTAQ